jgi:hypothetical protein
MASYCRPGGKELKMTQSAGSLAPNIPESTSSLGAGIHCGKNDKNIAQPEKHHVWKEDATVCAMVSLMVCPQLQPRQPLADNLSDALHRQEITSRIALNFGLR